MTVPVGPGYHTYVASLLDRMGDELGITWAKLATPAPAARGRVDAPTRRRCPASSIDPTGAFGSGDRHDAERGHLGWLRSALIAVRDARRQRADGLHLGTPPGARYTFDGAVATVLGPRDDAWLERALADPRVAADVWPWVADAMDARYLLGRALTQLWLEVRWRPPAGPDEIQLVDDVLGTLRRAYPLEPGLAWPWPAWRELFQLRRPDRSRRRGRSSIAGRGRSSAGRPAMSRRRSATAAGRSRSSTRVGPSRSRARSPSPGRPRSGPAARPAGASPWPGPRPAEGGHPMTAERFLQQVAGHLGRDAIEHDDGVVRGRARLASDPSSGVEVATVEGFSAVRGRGAAIRIEIDDPQDWKWALDTWRGSAPGLSSAVTGEVARPRAKVGAVQTIDGRPVFAATDLVAYLACEHLTQLERASLAGLVERPMRDDPELDVIRRRGFQHEARYLADLEAAGRSAVRIELDGSIEDRGDQLRAAARETIDAMAAGADVVYQATFFDGTWRGHADFLLRVDDPARPSRWGPWHYEVADTKLARHVKASAVLQICSYIDQLERIQGVRPEWMHVALGGSARAVERLRVDDYMAYYRSARDRFLATMARCAPGDIPAGATYPEPVDHCDVCRWAAECVDPTARRRPPELRSRDQRSTARGADQPRDRDARGPRRPGAAAACRAWRGPERAPSRGSGIKPGSSSRAAGPAGCSRASAARARPAGRSRARPRHVARRRRPATSSSISKVTPTPSTTGWTTCSGPRGRRDLPCLLVPRRRRRVQRSRARSARSSGDRLHRRAAAGRSLAPRLSLRGL